ncbi:hypothetical protein GGP41_009375 [Bipolaris sorokiniana]|uniref:Uncharacterized protein n=1 Tax=Cochliobolus sativus TaxID=45130 RepID=A0A8H6DRM6_COCSA|nr:hypothetical protein GGP41_009375 [Bipolaris sorokiniana]
MFNAETLSIIIPSIILFVMRSLYLLVAIAATFSIPRISSESMHWSESSARRIVSMRLAIALHALPPAACIAALATALAELRSFSLRLHMLTFGFIHISDWIHQNGGVLNNNDEPQNRWIARAVVMVIYFLAIGGTIYSHR